MLREPTLRSAGRTTALRCLLAFLLICLAFPRHPAKAFAEKAAPGGSPGDIAVVVNTGVSVDDLSMADLRKVLLGDRQYWSSNQRVTLLIRAPVARERDILLRRVYQMSEAQFRQYWIAKVFRAETSAGPKIVSSNKIASELVGALPGSIAFIDVTEVPKGLKIVKVDGRLPGEKGYALSN